MKEAIEAKQQNIEIYRAAVLADEVWLFIHSYSDDFLNGAYGEQTVRQAMYGAQLATHSFDRIYFFDVRCGVQQVFVPGMPSLSINHDLAPGYPAVTHYQYAGPAFRTTSADAAEPVLYEFDVAETHTIIIEPIDPDYAKRGKPAVRIKPAKAIRIRAFSDRAEFELIFE